MWVELSDVLCLFDEFRNYESFNNWFYCLLDVE